MSQVQDRTRIPGQDSTDQIVHWINLFEFLDNAYKEMGQDEMIKNLYLHDPEEMILNTQDIMEGFVGLLGDFYVRAENPLHVLFVKLEDFKTINPWADDGNISLWEMCSLGGILQDIRKYTEEELLAEHYKNVYQPDDMDAVRMRVRTSIEKGIKVDMLNASRKTSARPFIVWSPN